MFALTRMACPAPIPDTEHTTDAFCICTRSAVLIAVCSCDAKPAAVCGIGVLFAKHLL
jgi:hypothetical protein